ncbi:TetR/AcrR family transcriptional regulator [Pseudomonas sp. RIT-PI-S]|uniref:TetR/AcrR family transcriptional regulator n=1 Tax=Pseudomonas sp. RIT-PI-S TaxID=3035295 RepID=UPI0021D8B5B1|nr:TetR/AcrR family transcriptional regulator [Pseudomonas sp. RIT-PI-S]
MPWPEEQRDHTRQRILDSAARLFALHGFDAISLDDLMADAGLTRGAFYHHFRTKTELYGEAIIHAGKAGSAYLDTLGDAGLALLVEHYLRVSHCEGENLRCPLAFMATDVTHREQKIRRSYTRTFEAFVKRLQAGLAGASPRVRERAFQLAATLIGGVAIARALDDPELAQELLAACREGGQALVDEGS